MAQACAHASHAHAHSAHAFIQASAYDWLIIIIRVKQTNVSVMN